LTTAATCGGFAAERRPCGQEISIDSGGRRAPGSSGAAARRSVANADTSVREYVFYVFFLILEKRDILRFFDTTCQQVAKSR